LLGWLPTGLRSKCSACRERSARSTCTEKLQSLSSSKFAFGFHVVFLQAWKILGIERVLSSL